ncbi:anaerobic ribonucleoside-triphosphate reductase activating protein [Uliginosibacterium aquaticum]|uniref:Anaerobic ribonucleoside-triphosphate reductase activating protein n=1 Tax=Uliginosibacterium aquaticum TaxID=2731212 RepID=A0ABX2IH46_9RHOO|nr:anaerobic ribonucleoside-triphosphate reductase activating protein [Uliginosibacterium aquaticum]NSL56131.1 anaerobic ribonucleoside-triphosphate reductase activating protein [Uliginosibacterium aquaticum]
MTSAAHAFIVSPWTARIRIGAFNPAAEHDWPGRRTATLFLHGCPWRCAYCHNPELQSRSSMRLLSWEKIATELATHRHTIDGVVFSGGEPTADSCLPDAILAVKGMGFAVGLHTSGAYPERLEKVLPLLDWVGFDLKSDYDGYDTLTGAPGSAARATRSAQLIVASGVTHEFRLTWHHELLSEDAALLAAHFAQHLGAQRFVLQVFRPEGVTHPAIAAHSLPSADLVEQIRGLFTDFELRGELCGLAI